MLSIKHYKKIINEVTEKLNGMPTGVRVQTDLEGRGGDDFPISTLTDTPPVISHSLQWYFQYVCNKIVWTHQFLARDA